MLPALIAGVVSTLIKNNLPKVAQAVVDKGVGYVEEKLGIPLKPEMTPEELSIIAAAATKHEEFKMDLYFKDIEGARDMQKAALVQEDVFIKRFAAYFAIFWAVSSVAYLMAITFIQIPVQNLPFANTIIGFLLGTIVSTIINFFYGSSYGSKIKDELNRKFFTK